MPRAGLAIPTKAAWAVLLSTLTCGLTALVIHQAVSGVEKEDDLRRQVTGWAELGARQVGEAIGSSESDPARGVEQFRRWTWAMLQNPDAVAALLVDNKGEWVACAPESAEVSGLKSLAQTGPAWSRQTFRFGGMQREVRVAVSPVRCAPDLEPVGSVVLLATAGQKLVRVWHLVWLAGPLIGLSVAAALAVRAWLRTTLDRPLELLARDEKGQGPRWAEQLPVERDDELGGIARNLARLHQRVAHAENRVQVIEKDAQVRVADKTKRVEIMLWQAQKSAWLDSLTRLYNRRFLDEKLQSLFDEQRAAREDMTLIAFDVDHFKTLNDTLGHAAGDDLLAFTGELLRGSLRPTDIGVRCGGDEFLVIMLGASACEGSALAERIVRLFAQQGASTGVKPAVSLSAGVASLCGDRPRDAGHLLHLADEALYRAKRGGRNAVATLGARSTRKGTS
jgi:diguanylate cyclase (GGDEF)-like protein